MINPSCLTFDGPIYDHHMITIWSTIRTIPIYDPHEILGFIEGFIPMKAQMFNLFFMVNPIPFPYFIPIGESPHVTEEKMRTFSVKPCAGTPSPCVLPRRPWPIARPGFDLGEVVEKTWGNHWFYWYLMGIYDTWEYLMVISGYCWFKWILHGYLSKDRRGFLKCGYCRYL